MTTQWDGDGGAILLQIRQRPLEGQQLVSSNHLQMYIRRVRMSQEAWTTVATVAPNDKAAVPEFTDVDPNLVQSERSDRLLKPGRFLSSSSSDNSVTLHPKQRPVVTKLQVHLCFNLEQ